MVTTEELCAELEREGVTVSWEHQRPKLGHYDNERRRITLEATMTHRTEKCILTHEYDHAMHQDEPTKDKRDHGRRERRADAYAARRLISPAEYAIAEAVVGSDPRALAEELDVCVWVVRAFQREAGNGRAWTGVPSTR